MEPINLDDYEAQAQRCMDPAVWDTYAQGSEDERTLRANRAAYDEIWLPPRGLGDVRTCDTSTTALGDAVALPVLIPPTPVHRLAHAEGERATARASRAAGTIMVASTLASCRLEEIARAARAAAAGVDGIIVSNHGGRQLDGTLPTIAVLPEIVAAVDGRCEVYVDGGVRRGTDVLKALALGARAVLVGRPVIWGLAVGGEAGGTEVLRLFPTQPGFGLRPARRPRNQCVGGSPRSFWAPRERALPLGHGV